MIDVLLSAISGLTPADADGKAGNPLFTILRVVALTFLAGSTPWMVAKIKLRLYDLFFETAFVSDTNMAFYRLDEYMTKHNQSSVYRLEVYDMRDAMIKQFGGEGRASWKTEGMCGEQTPVFGSNSRLSLPSGWVWLERRPAAGFARAGPNAKVTLSGDDRHYSLCKSEYITVSTLRWHSQAIKELFEAAHEQTFSRRAGELSLYSTGETRGQQPWGRPTWRASRPWASAILPAKIKQFLLDDVTRFLSKREKEWYNDRGVPHRRGYLLCGPPGAGKTTLATALASKIGMDVYIVNPAAPNMDDAKLTEYFRKCPSGNMLLIEDIDCVMPQRPRDKKEGGAETSKPTEKDKDASKVTLSGLLNAIDGVASQEGSILLASTNHPELLDHALVRPGRFDVKIHFTNATPTQAKVLFQHFYPIDWLNDHSTDHTACVCHASAASAVEKTGYSADIKTAHAGKYDQADIDKMSQEFADALSPAFEGKGFSMAALQAFLLTKKDDPRKAVDEAAAWAVEQVTKNRNEEEQAKKEKEQEEKAKKEAEEKLKDENEQAEKDKKDVKVEDGAKTEVKPALTVATTSITTAEEEGYDSVSAEDALPSSPS